MEPRVRHPAIASHLLVLGFDVGPGRKGPFGGAPGVLDQETTFAGVVSDGKDCMAARDALFGRRRGVEDSVRINVAGAVEIGVGVEVGAEDERVAVVDAFLEVGNGRWLHRFNLLQAVCVRCRWVDDTVPGLWLNDSVVTDDSRYVGEGVVPRVGRGFEYLVGGQLLGRVRVRVRPELLIAGTRHSNAVDGLANVGSVVVLDLPKRIFLGVLILVVNHFSIIGTPSTSIEVDEKARRIAFVIADTVGFDEGVTKSSGDGVGSTAVERSLIINRRTLCT